MYESKLSDDVKILVLSGAQPGDVVKLQSLPISYDDDDENNDSKPPCESYVTVEKWPLISCSGHEGEEETGWQISNHVSFSLLWSPSKEKNGIGTQDIRDITQSSDKFSFNFYNVMLVFVSKAIVSSPETEGGPFRVSLIYERAGIGLLHYKALRYALPLGPQWEDILLC